MYMQNCCYKTEEQWDEPQRAKCIVVIWMVVRAEPMLLVHLFSRVSLRYA